MHKAFFLTTRLSLRLKFSFLSSLNPSSYSLTVFPPPAEAVPPSPSAPPPRLLDPRERDRPCGRDPEDGVRHPEAGKKPPETGVRGCDRVPPLGPGPKDTGEGNYHVYSAHLIRTICVFCQADAPKEFKWGRF